MMDPSHVFVIVDTLEMVYHVKVRDRMRLRSYRFKISTLFISMHHGGTATLTTLCWKSSIGDGMTNFAVFFNKFWTTGAKDWDLLISFKL